MSGIEILNQYQVTGDPVHNDEAIMITFFLCLGVLTVAGILTSICERDARYVVLGLTAGLIVGFCVSIPVADITAQPGEPETYYQVTIDDSVSLNEFRDKYEIIEQEGKIYTVKEKTIE